MTIKKDGGTAGPEVQPLGKGGSYVIDPATGCPVVPVSAPGLTAADVPMHENAESVQAGKKLSTKEGDK